MARQYPSAYIKRQQHLQRSGERSTSHWSSRPLYDKTTQLSPVHILPCNLSKVQERPAYFTDGEVTCL